ncbi:hypothetical protein QT971_19125 [Microcoleus sp. herbarium19]|uniref:hypothetical protein n=1 Tax=unclassified Microcoleus TaxID=2642155 RepID=UPI002FD476C8
MKRRKFIYTVSLASASFATSSGIITPQRSDAFLLGLVFSLVRGIAFDYATTWALNGVFNFASGGLKRRRQEWFDRRLEAQLAQEDLVSKLFSPENIYIAETMSPEYKYILAAAKQENLGENIAFSLPRLIYDEPVLTKFSGPAALGLAVATKFLKEKTRMSPAEIQRAIYPPSTAAAKFHDNMGGWNKSGTFFYPTGYRPGSAGVLIDYAPVDPRPNGYGILKVQINIDPPITLEGIKVKYAS